MEHVLRGGAWNAATREEQQSSYRFDSPPGARLDHDGFRCVLSLPPR
jgi:formylglycine-generating enzyme required for sulfatase activity